MNAQTHVFRLADGLPICRFPDAADELAEKLAKQLISHQEQQGCFYRYYFIKTNKFLFISTTPNILEPLSESFRYDSENLLNTPYYCYHLSQQIERTRPENAVEKSFAKLAQEVQLSKQLAEQNLSKALERGQKLADIETITNNLAEDSKSVLKSSKKLDRAALMRKYGVLVVIAAVLLVVLLVKLFK